MAGQYVVVVPSERLVIARLGVRGAPLAPLMKDAVAAVRSRSATVEPEPGG
jgi:hypothetical protein